MIQVVGIHRLPDLVHLHPVKVRTASAAFDKVVCIRTVDEFLRNKFSLFPVHVVIVFANANDFFLELVFPVLDLVCNQVSARSEIVIGQRFALVFSDVDLTVYRTGNFVDVVVPHDVIPWLLASIFTKNPTCANNRITSVQVGSNIYMKYF